MPGDTSRFSDNPFRDPNLTPEQVRVIGARNDAIRIYHATGDPRPAIEAGLFPERDEDFSSDYYRAWGYGYIKIGGYDRAVAAFGQSIILSADDAEAYSGRGNAYIGMVEYDKAIEDFNRAIELNPSDAGTYHNRGVVYDLSGDYDSAIADFSKSIDLDPTDADAYDMRGAAYREKAELDFRKAEELRGE